MSVPDRVKKIRESLGKTQKDMAALIQISYRTWQNYEDGVNSPGWDACGALVKLGFNANWLLTGIGEMRLGEAVEAGIQAPIRVKATGTTDRSPVKQAAVSYIDEMTDAAVAEVIRFLVPQQTEVFTDDIRLKNLSPEGKARVRAAIEARIKEIEDESANDLVGQRLTGT